MKACLRRILFLTFISAINTLSAQTSEQINRLWRQDTQFPQSGFAVKDRLQNPVFGITAGVIPGVMPIPVRLQIDGTVKSWARTGYYWEEIPSDIIYSIQSPAPADSPALIPPYDPINPGGPGGEWIAEGQEVFRPIYGTIHFGYTIPFDEAYGSITEKSITVLEDGSTLDDLTPLNKISPGQNLKLFAQYSLSSLPAARISISSDAAYATWLTSLSGLGSAWSVIIQNQAAPSGFSPSGIGTDSQYKVVIDRYKARVFQYLPNLGTYLPVMWRDRYGNIVTFKWERKTTGIPTSASEMYCLTINNEQNKGAKIQWTVYPDTNTIKDDLVRVDFININAPSMHIKGYPGISPQLPPVMTPALTPDPVSGIGQIMAIRPKTGGPINRPTSIVLTSKRSDLPAWNYGWQIPSQTSGEQSATRRWELTYNGTEKNQIYTFKDPTDLTTTFTYSQGSTLHPFGITYRNIPVGFTSYGTNYPMKFMRVTSASTKDTNQTTSAQTWDWHEADQLVTNTSTFDNVSLTTKTWYNGSALTNTDRANGVWVKRETYDGNILLASAENLETKEAGVDSTLTAVSLQKFTKKDEPSYTVETETGIGTNQGTYRLRITKITIRDSGASPKKVQETTYGHSQPDWADLNPGDLISVSTTNYNSAGSPLTPVLTQTNTWTGVNLSKQYISSGSSQTGAEYTYNTSGQLTKAQPYYKEGTTPQYNTAWQTFEYNSANKQLNKITQTDGTNIYTTQATTFDTNGLPTATSDQLGVTANTTYDDRGRIKNQTRAGITTVCTYPTELTLRTETSAQGSGDKITTEQTYDSFGRITNSANPDGSATTYTYQGHTVITVTKKNNIQTSKTTATSDQLGRPLEIQRIAGTSIITTTTYTYTTTGSDPGTYKVTAQHTKGNSTQTTVQTINILGQLLKVTGPQTGTTHEYTYDGSGNIIEHRTTTPQGTQTRAFTYDGLGRLLTRNEPETGTTTFSNYKHSQPQTIEETLQGTAKRVRNITYDDFGRLKTLTSGTDSLIYTYQTSKPLLQNARRVQTTGTVLQDYIYDAYGRLTEEKTTGADNFIARVQYEYDQWNNINKVTYPGASSSAAGRYIYYQNNIYGQPINIYHNATSGAVLASFTYDGLSRRSELIFGSCAKNKYSYDAMNRLSKWEVTPYNTSTITNNFTYDNFGYLSGTGEWNITNDYLGKIQAAAGYGINTTHTHDDFGNNISHQANANPNIPPATMINWSFPPLTNNRIPAQTATGAQTWWQYNVNGEAVWVGKAPGGNKIELAWDGLGLLKAVSDSGNTHEFTYNPSGLRIRDKRTGTNSHDKRYVYTTGGTLISAHELSTSGQITGRRDIVYANGEAIAEIDENNNIYELHNNYLGSTRYITNGKQGQSNTGQIIGEQAFGPYGEQITGTYNGKTLPSGYKPLTGYTGHLNEDLTGLIYMKGRYYSPLWHRFINSDQGVDPKSINQFAYGNGMPFMAADPSGMRACIIFRYEYDVADQYTASNTVTVTILANPYHYKIFCFGSNDDYGRGASYGGRYIGGGDSGGGDAEGSANSKNSKELTPKDIDKAACEAYKAIAKMFGGIPAGRTEAGAKLYIDNNKVTFSDIVSHTAPEGGPLTIPDLLRTRVPGITVGYLHTHPEHNAVYKDGNKIPNYLIGWANVSSGDISVLYDSFPSKSFGYLTTSELWKSNKIIRFQTEKGVDATYNMIDCGK